MPHTCDTGLEWFNDEEKHIFWKRVAKDKGITVSKGYDNSFNSWIDKSDNLEKLVNVFLNV